MAAGAQGRGPGRHRAGAGSPVAAGDLTGSRWAGTPGGTDRHQTGADGRRPAAGTAEARAGADDARAAGVPASIAPALMTAKVRIAAHLPGRQLERRPVKAVTAFP